MDRKEDRGLLFDEKTISAIRDKFCRIDVDADGSQRLFLKTQGDLYV